MAKPNPFCLGPPKKRCKFTDLKTLAWNQKDNSRLCLDQEPNQGESTRFWADENSGQGVSTRRGSRSPGSTKEPQPPAADSPQQRDCCWLEASLTLQDVGRAHVNLGDHHENRHIECQCQAQVLLGHPHDASIAAHLPQHRKNCQGERDRCWVGTEAPKRLG